jgi:hypothetical protein
MDFVRSLSRHRRQGENDNHTLAQGAATPAEKISSRPARPSFSALLGHKDPKAIQIETALSDGGLTRQNWQAASSTCNRAAPPMARMAFLRPSILCLKRLLVGVKQTNSERRSNVANEHICPR